MTHEDKGHYALKHENLEIDQAVCDHIKSSADNNLVTCASAHRIAGSLGKTPAEVGAQIDLLEFQLTECQLGLFGYPDKQKKIDPDIEISPQLNEELDKAAEDKRISCHGCWEIAKKLKIKKLDVSSACEKKNIKIKQCQLGAF
jgi:hypothetical protein